MLCLGIEGTAHTAGVGVVDSGGKVLFNGLHSLRPEKGGIHPREAANHHAEWLVPLIRQALDETGLAAGDLGMVAFSRGPGLGPCLRTAATAARAFAGAAGLPLAGVNHCVAHLEIGRLACGVEDPVMLYASGGNTQVIAFGAGRYRVFGETLDIGIGNMLDKFGREAGLPFPAGPRIEELARDGSRLLPLAYSVKGMDLSFSGLLTAALNLLGKGEPLPDVAYSLQEHSFSMLVEVAERAMAHVGRDDLLLAGGVARNGRLRAMAEAMARERGGRVHVPPGDLCVDNGAMVAWLGLLQFGIWDFGLRITGRGLRNADTTVQQDFRTDEVDVTWRKKEQSKIQNPKSKIRIVGAEAVVNRVNWHGVPAVSKERVPKGYRHPELDARLRRERGRNEARLLRAFRAAGVSTPALFALREGTIVMEYISGVRVKEELSSIVNPKYQIRICRAVGMVAGLLHAHGLVHGDFTTSNMLWDGRRLHIIDPSMGAVVPPGSAGVELLGVDLHLLQEAFRSAHPGREDLFRAVLKEYSRTFKGAPATVRRMGEIEQRGRYVHRR